MGLGGRGSVGESCPGGEMSGPPKCYMSSVIIINYPSLLIV